MSKSLNYLRKAAPERPDETVEPGTSKKGSNNG